MKPFHHPGPRFEARRRRAAGARLALVIGTAICQPVLPAARGASAPPAAAAPVGEPIANAAGLFAPSVKRVIFLGDSITHAGTYVAIIATFHHLRYPARAIEFIDLGLPSETVSGLSEPDHAGGRFPRPVLRERLARTLEKTKPDLVIACYGTNDGIYLPFDDARAAAFQAGMRELHAAVQASGAQIIHLTPPVFDEVRAHRAAGYAAALDRYSDWLLAQRAAGWHVIDVHGPMQALLEARRRADPAYAFSTDGIHPDAAGHWLMAQAVLRGLGATEAAQAASAGALFASFPDGPARFQAESALLTRWRDAWLAAIGHRRPGLPKGEPIDIDAATGQARFRPPAPTAPAGGAPKAGS